MGIVPLVNGASLGSAVLNMLSTAWACLLIKCVFLWHTYELKALSYPVGLPIFLKVGFRKGIKRRQTLLGWAGIVLYDDDDDLNYTLQARYFRGLDLVSLWLAINCRCKMQAGFRKGSNLGRNKRSWHGYPALKAYPPLPFRSKSKRHWSKWKQDQVQVIQPPTSTKGLSIFNVLWHANDYQVLLITSTRITLQLSELNSSKQPLTFAKWELEKFQPIACAPACCDPECKEIRSIRRCAECDMHPG